MIIIFSIFLLMAIFFVGRDTYLVWFDPNKFIEMTVQRRNKRSPSMRGVPLLFDDDALIKWDRALLPIILYLSFLFP